MSAIYGYSREAVRVKVKKCESNIPPEWRKFSVDPQITSLEVLYSILAKAFEIKSDFSISYRALDPSGQETYLSVLSDWDLDAAFLRAHNTSIQTANEPCLNLRVDIKAFSEAQDWEVNSPATKEISAFQQSLDVGQKYVQTMQNKLPGLIINQMEKTFSMVQRALNLTEDQMPVQPPRPPLCDSEFRNFLDSVGQIVYPSELRKVIFSGGIDPSLRRVVWKHILNVYPNGMTGKERMDYMKRKAAEYYKLRETWRMAVQRGPVIGELAYVTSMVRKDVLRTDRLHSFYAGSDDNQNIASLFNILTTYALNHPSVSYCQGMSDIASPLLVTMGDEAHAYICFCAIMTRLKVNFMLDGIAMTQKFTHLAEALQFYDPEFFEYLKAQQADDLLFCYRWLLLEMKREFAFEDSLRMLEVLWSSIRLDPPTKELELYEKIFDPLPPDVPAPKSPSVIMRTPRENAYTKVCALRRQSSSVSSLSCSPNQSSSPSLFLPLNKLNAAKRMNQSLDENISRKPRIRRAPKSHQSLDETKMLMLMENIALFKDEYQSDNVFENPESDDDGVNVPPEAVEKDPGGEFVFHPTNPFLADAQEDGKNQNKVISQKSQIELENSANLANNNSESPTISPKRDTKGNLSTKTKMSSKTLFSTSPGNIISKQNSNKKGGHFKDLKEKIAASKKGILTSLDKVDNQTIKPTHLSKCNSMPVQQQQQQSVDEKDSPSQRKTSSNKVKNLNELLNFASINKSRISDKLVTSSKTIFEKRDSVDHGGKHHRPLIKLTKNSFDDSDSSTMDGNSVSSTQSHPTGKQTPLQLQLTSIVAQTQLSLDGSSPDDSQDYYPMTTSMTRELRLELESLDRQVFGDANVIGRSKFLQDASDIEYEKLEKDSLDLVEVQGSDIVPMAEINDMIVMRNHDRKNAGDPLNRISVCSTNTDVFVWENPLHQMSGASSCNFNEVVENNAEELGVKGYINGNVGRSEATITNAMTPDEQQELEYDGDIVIECSGDDMKKSVTPLRLIQQKASNIKLRDDSDSDNTESWKNNPINPFLPPKSVSQELIENAFTDSHPMVGTVSASMVELEQGQSFAPGQRPMGCEEASEANISFSKPGNSMLPPPDEFGGGNPFLMFLSLTLLLQHRNFVMKSGMDYNEMAMHFDKMVRKHEVTRVLNQARRMYADYLKTQTAMASAAGDSVTKS